jgi:amino acid transporter
LPELGSSGEPSLRRAVSRWEVLGVTVNDVVGSGVYLLPAATAALLGGASLWAILVAGVSVSLLVLCFAEAASHFDQPGGGYLYTREAFGPFVAFEVGWMKWLAGIATPAALSNGLAQAMGFLWPGAAGGWGRVALIGGALTLFTCVNVVGVRWGARTAGALAVVKLMPLLALVGVGIFLIDAWGVIGDSAPPEEGFGEAVLLILFAYVGFENSAAAAGEYRDPRRDVPFAQITLIVGVTVLYFLVQLVALGALPDLAERVEGAPLADAAARLMGGWAGMLLTAGAAISILGTIGGSMFTIPRYLFAMAEDGFGPRILARVHPRWRTPHVAIVAQASLAFGAALSGTFVQLALLSIVARLAMYVSTAAAVPFLRRKFPRTEDTIVLPWGPTIPIAALFLCLAFLASAELKNLVFGAVALVVGVGIYALRRLPAANLRADGERAG